MFLSKTDIGNDSSRQMSEPEAGSTPAWGRAGSEGSAAGGGGIGGAGTDSVLASEAILENLPYFLRMLVQVRRRLITDFPDLSRDFELLVCLVEARAAHAWGEPITQKDLVALTHGVFSASSMSRAVRDGVNADLLNATSSRTDRRVVEIDITAKGEELLRSVSEEVFHKIAALTADRK